MPLIRQKQVSSPPWCSVLAWEHPLFGSRAENQNLDDIAMVIKFL
jgi:hypothetical protein